MTDTLKDLAELRRAVEEMKNDILKEEAEKEFDAFESGWNAGFKRSCESVVALIDGLIENLQRRAADYEKISRRLNNVKNHTDEDIALELRSVLGDEK